MKEFRNLVSSEDFSCEELLELMELGEMCIRDRKKNHTIPWCLASGGYPGTLLLRNKKLHESGV